MTQAIEAENTKDTSKSVSGRAENLRGSSVTQILYYINENHLVLAVTGDSSALLLTGYDTKNVSVYDPVTSETTTMAIADAQEYFEAYDCAFFAWIKIRKSKLCFVGIFFLKKWLIALYCYKKFLHCTKTVTLCIIKKKKYEAMFARQKALVHRG